MPTLRQNNKNKDIEEVLYYAEDPKKAKVVFEINKTKKIVKFYPKPGKLFLSKVLITGFTEIPTDIVSESGYFKSGFLYFLNARFGDKKTYYIEIAKDKINLFRKDGKKGYKLILNYDFVEDTIKKLSTISYEASRYRGEIFNICLSAQFPKHFPAKQIMKEVGRGQARRIVKNLDENAIEYFTNNEAQDFVDYFIKLIGKRKHKQKFFNLAKIKVDEIALGKVVNKFEQLIDSNVTESELSEFLIENLFVIDSKYTAAVPEINLVLGGQRRVDFGLIDSQGFMDIFEIKRANTKLLAQNSDHGNFYWHVQAVKAITQIEKYLFNAESKKDSLISDLKRERETEIPENLKLIRPRAVLIMGHSDQLNSTNKKEDFKILRQSLKNIEVIPYDELLQRMKNQQNKIFIKG